jgi:hypothetical protein
MLLLLEIVLTIIACIVLHKAGQLWAKGLIPVGALIGTAFLVGLLLGGAPNWIILLDIASIVWMLVIIFGTKKTN